jgi:hypothetical protein
MIINRHPTAVVIIAGLFRGFIMDKSFLKPSERFKLWQRDFQQQLLTADRSHLEPNPPFTPIELVYTGDRDPRYQSPYRDHSKNPHYWYWRPVQLDTSLLDLRARCAARFLEHKAKLAELGIQLVLDPSRNAYFWSVASKFAFSATGLEEAGSRKSRFDQKNRQSLPVETVQNATFLPFSASARESAEMAKSLGSCNTQTNGRRLPKIDINRSDFLTR